MIYLPEERTDLYRIQTYACVELWLRKPWDAVRRRLMNGEHRRGHPLIVPETPRQNLYTIY